MEGACALYPDRHEDESDQYHLMASYRIFLGPDSLICQMRIIVNNLHDLIGLLRGSNKQSVSHRKGINNVQFFSPVAF